MLNKISFKFNAEETEVLINGPSFNELRKKIGLGPNTSKNGVLIKSNNHEIELFNGYFSNPVPNITRYLLISTNKLWHLKKVDGSIPVSFEECKAGEPLKENQTNKIFLVLESPHRDEYKLININGNFELMPIAPACGQTGKNIHSNFVKLLEKLTNIGLILDDKLKYHICIVNPVPYQASLGSLYVKGLVKEVRNKVWLKLFQKTEADFINLIIKCKPLIVLNACTKELNGNIESALNKLENYSFERYKIYHPSSPWFGKKGYYL